MLPATLLSPLDPTSYAWQQSHRDPSLWQRRALSTECMWLSRPKDLHELFICSAIALNSPIPRPTLDSAANAVWQILRFQVPELGAKAFCAENGTVYLQYQPPSLVEVGNWVERTSCFEGGKCELEFRQLRANVLSKKEGHDSDNAFLLLYSDDSRDLVENVQIILYLDHQVADGNGIKILLGKYLSLLASALSNQINVPEGDMNWQESSKNLSEPWIQHLNGSQVASGPQYEEAVERNRDIIIDKLKSNPGLPLSQNTRPSSQETRFITLPSAQITAILRVTKRVIGPTSNITHLCHAAMVLALLRSNPPASSVLYSPCWLNGRRYLQPTPACPSPTTDYIPICLSFAPIIFADLEELTLLKTADRGEVRAKLIKACRVATGEYVKIRERGSMLPECVSLWEDIARKRMLNNQKESTTTASEAPDAMRTENEMLAAEGPRTVPQRTPGTADPYLLSDGIMEQCISHTYPSSSSTPILTVNDVRFASHAEKNLIVRMSSWRGRTTIAGEWRGCDYDNDMIVSFLEDVVRILGMIVDEDEHEESK